MDRYTRRERVKAELTALAPRLRRYSTPEMLRQQYPDFALWGLLDDKGLRELLHGDRFKPDAYATTLVYSSRETLKADRRKLKAAGLIP
jgi:hypothetical protein